MPTGFYPIRSVSFVDREYFGDCDDEYDYARTEDAVQEAVQHALALQEFFARQKAAKKTIVIPEIPEVVIPEIPEVEEIWQMRQEFFNYGDGYECTKRPGKNSRQLVIGDRGGKSHKDSGKKSFLAEVIVDNRRFRV